MVHVLLTEHDEVIESLLLQCLDEPLDVGVGVRCPKRRLLPFRARRVEDRIKCFRKLRVPVVHQQFGMFLLFPP